MKIEKALYYRVFEMKKFPKFLFSFYTAKMVEVHIEMRERSQVAYSWEFW